MMRNVYLHGRLKKQFGGAFAFDVATAGEAVRALHVNLPGFLDALKEGAYQVIRGDRKTGMQLELEDVNAFQLGQADLHIVPVVVGSGRGGNKGGGALKAILGVALIGAAIFFSGGALATPIMGGTGLLGGITYGNLALLGLTLALAGVSQMLSPKEDAKDDTEKDENFSFSGPGNAYEQGNPVPLIYGRVITGSVLVSGSIDIEPR